MAVPLPENVVTRTADGLTVDVRVIPRAGIGPGRNSWRRVARRLQSPPVDGAANEELIAVLAAALDVPKRQLTIIAGAAPVKRVRVGLG